MDGAGPNSSNEGETMKRIWESIVTAFFGIVIGIIASLLVVWEWDKHRKIVEDNELTPRPHNASIEAMTDYKKRINRVVEDIAKAEAEEMVEKWRKRFARR